LLDVLPLLHRSCNGSRRGFGDLPRTSSSWDPKPKGWDSAAASEGGATAYTPEDIELWRASFGFARRQHSLAQFGYTDDELLEWRKPFDELASDRGIDFQAFDLFVTRKYRDAVPDEQLKQKVQFFWGKFDRDGNSYIDFGEFIAAGFLFDVTWAKEKIRQEGIEDAFTRYASDGFMAEAHMFELMCDFRFFVSTATDVHKLMRVADQDRDGLVSLPDFVHWASDEDVFELLGDGRAVAGGMPDALDRKSRKRGGGGKRRKSSPPIPPAEPQD